MEISILSKISNKNLKSLTNFEDFNFWSEISLIHLQTEGLLFGYNFRKPIEKKILMHDIYFINADGQIPELLSIFRLENEFENFRYKQNYKKSGLEYLFREFATKDPEVLWEKILSRSHCSAFIKVLRDSNKKIKDLLLAHSTWDDYSAMIRIFKQ